MNNQPAHDERDKQILHVMDMLDAVDIELNALKMDVVAEKFERGFVSSVTKWRIEALAQVKSDYTDWLHELQEGG